MAEGNRLINFNGQGRSGSKDRRRFLRSASSALLLEGALALAAVSGVTGCAGDDGNGIFEQEKVCSSANKDQTEYELDVNAPLPFAGLVFTYVEQIPGSKDVRIDIGCDDPPFSIESGYVVPLSAEERISIPLDKVAKLRNIDSDPEWAHLDISVEDAR